MGRPAIIRLWPSGKNIRLSSTSLPWISPYYIQLKIVRISDYLEIYHMSLCWKVCINMSRNNLLKNSLLYVTICCYYPFKVEIYVVF
jgi:hypothetical protein